MKAAPVNTKKISIGALIEEAWQLMKGKKLNFWLLLLPSLFSQFYAFYRFHEFFVNFATFMSYNHNNFFALRSFNFAYYFGDFGSLKLIILGVVMAFVYLYTWIGLFVLGCDAVKGIPFDSNRLNFIFKRLGPAVVAAIIVELIRIVVLSIPYINWLLIIFLDPIFLLYMLAAFYKDGPFLSVKKVFAVLKKNFWQLFVAYYAVVIIALLLSITIIGVIWGLPFLMIAFGMLYREFYEK